MRIWSISFNGVWPVGAVALVVTRDADTAEHAVALFRQTWADAHPGADPEPVEARLLDCPPGAVHILHDGNY